MSDITEIVESSLANTVSKPLDNTQGGMHFFQYMVRAGLNLYPWWSPQRDVQLNNFWKQVDYVSGAIYTMESKMSSIPMKILARDQSIKEHVEDAKVATERLLKGAEFGRGWGKFFEKFVEALLTQDNGSFVEIIGNGSPDGPIIGAPITVRTLDSSRCQRTGNPLYPVLYHDMNGRIFKLHFTRVMFEAQMESNIEQMFGVGFCSVSRMINTAQRLLDILIYNQEKLGSRPRRGVIVTKGGLDPEDVKEAFRMVEGIEDSQALSRYSKIAVVGDSSLPDADLDLKDMSSLPDGFDERDSVEIGMALIAMATGMDARELFPAMENGATRADALIQHLKQRGKGPGQIIQMTESMFDAKYLPPHLMMLFDFQDDEEDRQSAETKEIRSRSRKTDIDSGAMDTHTTRAQMVKVGDLEEGQFERLELQDGRLADGTTVLALFYSKDPGVKKYLDLGVENPADIEENKWETLKPKVEKNTIDAMTIIVNSNNPDERWSAQKALAALDNLRKLYNPMPLNPQLPEGQKTEGQSNQDDGLTHPDPRVRHEDPTRAKQPPLETDELEPDSDDGIRKEAGELPSRPF